MDLVLSALAPADTARRITEHCSIRCRGARSHRSLDRHRHSRRRQIHGVTPSRQLLPPRRPHRRRSPRRDGRRRSGIARYRRSLRRLSLHLVVLNPGKEAALARRLLNSPRNELLFSPASLWEIAIKRTLGRDDFSVEPRLLRRGLLDNGYAELPITSLHVVSIDTLPPLRKDPFDRLLLAQALTEGITLLTADAQLARYPGPVRKV